jgi:DNA polymerase III alpha subunit
MPDIDIDFADRTKVLDIIKHVPATLEDGRKHNTGVYCHKIPVNPITGQASIDYVSAEERGYFKIDFLNVGIYQDIKDEDHLNRLLETEPLWELLQHEEFVNQLFHLSGHGDVLKKTCPTSVEQLGAVLAMIRPAKRYLIGKNWTTIMNEVWIKPETGEYYFKKSHAISYAMAVIVHMNLLCEKLSYDYS